MHKANKKKEEERLLKNLKFCWVPASREYDKNTIMWSRVNTYASGTVSPNNSRLGSY